MTDLRPLRHRDFTLLYTAQSVSFLGTMISYVALPYQMYRATGSSLSVGLLGLAELVALLSTAFIGGVIADAVDRRRLALITDVGLAGGSAALVVLAINDAPSWPLYFVAAWMSGISGLQRPSMEALVVRLVPKDEQPAVAALTLLRGSIGMIAGPALGGALIASVGLALTYGVDVASYAVSLACLWLIRRVPPPEGTEPPTFAAVREGFRYARSRQELIGTYLVDFVAMVFGMPLALFPALSERLGGPSALGLLYAAPAGGALVASFFARWTSRIHRQGVAILIAGTVWGIAIVAFGFSPALSPALVFLMIAGGADAISGVFRMTMWNQTIPDALRGRLASIEMVSCTSGPLLGHAEAGAVAAAFGVQASIVSGGVLCVIGVIACGWWLPRLVSYDAARYTAAESR